MEEKSWGNIRTLKANLIHFEIIFGLKVNFPKSLLVAVNMAVFWLVEAVVMLNCKISHIDFVYLGLPIGWDPPQFSFWHSLVEKIRKKRKGWKSKILSMGGRLYAC